MKLPNCAAAEIAPAKVRDYLLSTEHPVGRCKARFFAGLGYRREEWTQLRAALERIAQAEDAFEHQPGPYGRKYEVRGTRTGPNGRSAAIVTIWIVESGSSAPRFVAAIPGEGP